MIVLNRIDNRLIHGQVIEAWLPHLSIERIVVADDEAASDPLTAAAMALAVPPSVEVQLKALDGVDFAALAHDSQRTLLLFRDVAGVTRARERGLPNGRLNIGNVHARVDREQLTKSVFLSAAERLALGALGSSGMDVTLQAIPAERPVPFQR